MAKIKKIKKESIKYKLKLTEDEFNFVKRAVNHYNSNVLLCREAQKIAKEIMSGDTDEN